jgi:hypothetical protein
VIFFKKSVIFAGAATVTTESLNAMNSKLLVGGTFCDLEKVFDCVDRGTLLSKLKFYGIARILHFINLI